MVVYKKYKKNDVVILFPPKKLRSYVTYWVTVSCGSSLAFKIITDENLQGVAGKDNPPRCSFYATVTALNTV